MNEIDQRLFSRRNFLDLGWLTVLWGVLPCTPVWASKWAAQGTPWPDVPMRLDVTPGRFPPLGINGDDVSRYPNGKPAGFRGFADPCVRRDPLSGDLWMAYSWPHMEHLGGHQRNFAIGVETHLAVSKDGGNSWQRTHVLWKKTPARFTDRKKGVARDGFISHEVPNILPCVIDGNASWIGARLDYFLGREGNYKDRDNLSFCLRLMASATLPGLSSSPFATFGHDNSSPECEVDVNVCKLSSDFPPLFIPNEPALYFKDGRLYLVFVVMTFYGQSPDFPKSFVAVLSTDLRGPIRSWKWRYHGKLATNKEAKELGGEALTQIELALGRDGQLLAFLVPESWNAKANKEIGGDAFFGIRHHGCAVVEVASLDTPALKKNKDGNLAVRAFLYSSEQPEHGPGAAAYDPGCATGVLLTLRDISTRGNLSWSLHPTGLHP